MSNDRCANLMAKMRRFLRDCADGCVMMARLANVVLGGTPTTWGRDGAAIIKARQDRDSLRERG